MNITAIPQEIHRGALQYLPCIPEMIQESTPEVRQSHWIEIGGEGIVPEFNTIPSPTNSIAGAFTRLRCGFLNHFRYIKLPSLSRCRKFSLTWKDHLMLSGVALAIAAAAGSFFMNLAAAGVAFIALGILLAYSTWYVHHFDDGIKLQQTVDLLAQKNRELNAAKEKMEETAANLGRQYTQIRAVNAQLEQTLSSLQIRTQELQTENARLIRNTQDMQAGLQQFQQQNQSLQQKVTLLQQAIPILKEQIVGFAEQNMALGKDLNLLGQEVAGVDAHNRALAQTIQGFDMTFDQNVLQLSEQIQRAKGISQTVFSSLANHKKDLDARLVELHKTVGSLQTLDTTLQKQTQNLSTLQQQIATDTENLSKLQHEMQQTERALEDVKKAFGEETEKFQKIRLEIASEEAKLATTRQQLEAVTAKLSAAELALKNRVDEIERRQLGALEQVEKKIAGRIEEARAKKAELADLDRQIAQKKKDLAAV